MLSTWSYVDIMWEESRDRQFCDVFSKWTQILQHTEKSLYLSNDYCNYEQITLKLKVLRSTKFGLCFECQLIC